MLAFRVHETTVCALNVARFRVFFRFCLSLARGLPFSLKHPFCVWAFRPFVHSVRARCPFSLILLFSLDVFLASRCFVYTKCLVLAWIFLASAAAEPFQVCAEWHPQLPFGAPFGTPPSCHLDQDSMFRLPDLLDYSIFVLVAFCLCIPISLT